MKTRQNDRGLPLMRLTTAVLLMTVPATGCSFRQMHTVTVPAGTRLEVSLTRTLLAEESRPGDAFEARTVLPVAVDGVTVIPAGTIVRAVLSRKPDGGAGGAELTFDKFQNARGEWQDLPVIVVSEGGTATRIPAGQRLRMVTRYPMPIPAL